MTAERVEVLLDLRRYDDALSLAGSLLATGPDEPEHHVLLGRALDGLERHDEALAAAERALALRPSDEDALLLRAYALVELERTAEAEETLHALLREEPGHVPGHLALTLCLLLKRRFDEAWETATHLRTLAPDDADVHHAVGLVADFLPDEDAAESHRRALAIDPHHAQARHELMRAEPGSLREHARTLADLLRAEPQDPEFRRSVQDWADRTARRALLGAVGAYVVAGLVGVGGLAATILMVLWWRRLQRDVPPGIRGEVRRRLPRTPYLLLTWAVSLATALAAVALTFAPDPHALVWLTVPWLAAGWLVVPLWGVARWLRVPFS